MPARIHKMSGKSWKSVRITRPKISRPQESLRTGCCRRRMRSANSSCVVYCNGRHGQNAAMTRGARLSASKEKELIPNPSQKYIGFVGKNPAQISINATNENAQIGTGMLYTFPMASGSSITWPHFAQ